MAPRTLRHSKMKKVGLKRVDLIILEEPSCPDYSRLYLSGGRSVELEISNSIFFSSFLEYRQKNSARGTGAIGQSLRAVGRNRAIKKKNEKRKNSSLFWTLPKCTDRIIDKREHGCPRRFRAIRKGYQPLLVAHTNGHDEIPVITFGKRRKDGRVRRPHHRRPSSRANVGVSVTRTEQ